MWPAGRQVRVVVTDDVKALRRLLRIVLEEDGRFQVVGEAADGEEAIDVVGKTQPDLVLLDLSMPRMDGLEALPRLRDAAPESQVVVLSGFATSRMAPQAAALGAARYLEKGLTPVDLLRGLVEIIEGSMRPPGAGS